MQSRSELGSATAETAVVLPAIVAVFTLLLWGLGVGGAQLRCIDAARAAARAAARGETSAAVLGAAREIAPPGAQVSMRRSADRVDVTVSARVRPPGPVLSGLAGFAVRGSATGAAEPGLSIAGLAVAGAREAGADSWAPAAPAMESAP